MRATTVLQTVLKDRPRDAASVLLLAEAALALAFGWAHVVPLLAVGPGAIQPQGLCQNSKHGLTKIKALHLCVCANAQKQEAP
ncbi:MAG: hypothetical protein ABJH07_08075 [Sedimentitalea sp.]|uniref:hypothetical protein n=1 Tax=Sedimentitalea sp. TaxID=2048915 RepID=UPI0032667C6C